MAGENYAQRLTAQYEAARERVARLINAPLSHDIVWTRGTTEAINIVAQCYARPRLRPDDEIIVSVAEHHANLVPWLTGIVLPAMKGSLLLHLINDACVVALVVWFWMPIVTRLFAGWLKKA